MEVLCFIWMCVKTDICPLILSNRKSVQRSWRSSRMAIHASVHTIVRSASLSPAPIVENAGHGVPATCRTAGVTVHICSWRRHRAERHNDIPDLTTGVRISNAFAGFINKSISVSMLGFQKPLMSEKTHVSSKPGCMRSPC